MSTHSQGFLRGAKKARASAAEALWEGKSRVGGREEFSSWRRREIKLGLWQHPDSAAFAKAFTFSLPQFPSYTMKGLSKQPLWEPGRK
jgi:hypothetical protein